MPHANREPLGGQVIVRMAHVSRSQAWIPLQETFLSKPDRERADRFRFPEDRARFILGRGLLGACLIQHFGYPARPLNLAFTEQGRPTLPNDSQIEFSLSHTGDLVGVALSLQTKVGIDLEYMRPGTDLAGLAERIFCARDLAAFRALPENEAQTAFFRAWTGKEAYLKAQGTGLSGGIRNVSLSIPAGASTGRITHASEPAGGPEWRIEALPVPEGYVGSVVWNDSQKCLNFSVMDLTAST